MRFDPPADAVGPAEPLVIGVENEEITGLRRSRVGEENRREYKDNGEDEGDSRHFSSL
jgi:hypothetical protein